MKRYHAVYTSFLGTGNPNAIQFMPVDWHVEVEDELVEWGQQVKIKICFPTGPHEGKPVSKVVMATLYGGMNFINSHMTVAFMVKSTVCSCSEDPGLVIMTDSPVEDGQFSKK